MTKVPVKDFYNRIIGFIETDDRGNKTVKDFYNRVLGWYEQDTDVTKDFYHRIIQHGDMTSMLLGMSMNN